MTPEHAEVIHDTLIRGVESGEIVAFVRSDGELAYIATERASQPMLANSLTADEVRRIRAVAGVGKTQP